MLAILSVSLFTGDFELTFALLSAFATSFALPFFYDRVDRAAANGPAQLFSVPVEAIALDD